MMALQPNQKVKHPHPPANREAVADISAKHCVHCGRKSEHTARRKENFDELFRVPGVNEPKINIHGAVHSSFVPREQPLRQTGMIKNFVKCIGSEFTAEHGKKNAATKNWIDKTGRVARKQPAIAMQSRAAIGEIRLDVNLREASRVCHPFGDGWLFGQSLFEKVFSAELGLAIRFAVENYANAGALGGEWDSPEPAIDGAEQNCERAVDSFRAPHPVVVREDG